MTMWKTVSMRIRGAKTELADAGLEIDGMASSTSVLRDEIKSLTGGFDIMIDDSTFKSTYDIILGISNIYDKLSDTSQANILEMLAGKRQGNQLAAALGNAEDLVNVLETSQQSFGSALKEQEAYTQGIQYSIDRLSASMQEMSTTTLDSSTVKFFVDFANGVINATTAVGGLVPVIGTVGIALGTYKFLLPLLTKEMGALLLTETGVTATTMSQIVAQTGLNGAFALGSVAVKSFISSMLPILGIAAIIGGVVIAYDALNTSMEEIQENTSKLTAEYDDLQSQISSVNTELETASARMDELLGKDNLTFIEQTELDTLKETTKQLESQNRLLQEQADLKNVEVAKSVKAEFDKDMSTEYQSLTKTTTRQAGSSTYTTPDTVGEEEHIQEILDAYTKLSKIDKSIITDEESKKLADYKAELLDTGVKFNDYADRYKIDDETSQSWEKFAGLIDRTLNPEQYKTDLFEYVYNSKSFAKVKSQLDELALAGKLDESVITSNDRYNDILEQTGLTAKEVTEQINASVLATTQATGEASTSISSMFDEATNTSMDDFQSSLSTIQEALENVSDLDSSSIVDLMQEFSSFDWASYGVTGAQGVGNLESALQALAQETLSTATTAMPQLSSALRSMFDSMSSGTVDTQSLIDELDSLNAVLTRVKNGQSLSAEEISNLISKHETLAGAVVVTADGYSIEEDALISLINTQSEDANQSIADQINKTNNTITQTQARISAYITEAEALNALAASYSTTANSVEDYITQYGYSSAESEFGKDALDRYNNNTSDEANLEVLVSKLESLKGQLTKSGGYTASTSKGGSSSSSSETPAWLTDYNTKKEEYDHKLAMDEMTQEEYYNKLEKLNNKVYKAHKADFLDTYRQNQEEIYDGRKQIDDDLIKSKFDDNENAYNLGTITEEEYYSKLEKLNEKYYKNNTDHAEDYQTNLEKLYQYDQEKLKEAYQKKIDTINKVIDKYSDLRDIINDTAEGQSGDTQVSTYSSGIKSANQAISYIEKEINKLNKKKITTTFTQDDYDSQLETLQSALAEAYSSIDDFNNSISESVQTTSEDTMDALEDNYDNMTKYWENEQKAYTDIVNAQKEILQLKKEQSDYEKTIADKTKDISSVESRMTELQKAASTGDREANAELQKLSEDLTDKKADLADTQSDHEYDLANDALDKALDDNDKIVDAKLESLKNEYETQKANQEKLYNQLIDLTSKASSYTVQSYSTAIDDIVTKMEDNGISLNPDYVDSLKDAQAGSSSTATAVQSILSNANGDGKASSDLNKYVISKGYEQLSYANMAELASVFGISGVTADNIKKDTLTKNTILAYLRRYLEGSTFATGGFASLASGLGEDGIAFVKNREPILSVEQGVLFKEFIKNLSPLNNLVKLSTPNLSNVVTNNNSSPVVNINLPAGTTIDKSAINDWKQFVPQMTDAVSKELLNVQRQYK